MVEANPSYDVIVIGAGMVGAASALGCAQQDLNVALIEAYQPAESLDLSRYENRVSALTLASQNLLTQLGVWNDMLALRVSPYTDMHVWDAGGDGAIHFDAADAGTSTLGHIVENGVTQQSLWQQLSAHEKVTIYCPDKVNAVKRESALSHVTLNSGQQLTAPLVVVADGKNSAVRDMLGIDTTGWLYDQHAIVGTITTENSHQFTAWQRFMKNGPLAFLPLNNADGNKENQCSIVWSTSPEQAETLMALDEASFCKAITQASESILGDVIEIRDRGVFPLQLKHANTYIREGFVLIGDAAHAIHPLAGQGVNLGFQDVEALLEIIQLTRQQSRQPGSMRMLRQFERQRKGSNLTMLAAMDGFKRLFSNDNLPLSLIRNRGLSLVDQAGPLKQFLVRYAMG